MAEKIAHPGRIYGTYCAAYFAIILIIAVAEQLGLIAGNVLWICALLPLLAGLFSALLGQMGWQTGLAGQSVNIPFFSGMALSASWISAAGITALAGGFYQSDYLSLGFILGWTSGLTLASILSAPYLARAGADCVPEFLARQSENKLVPAIASLIILCAGFFIILAQIQALDLIASLLALPFALVAALVFLVILLVMLPRQWSGLRAAQIAFYTILLIGFLAPITMVAFQQTGNPVAFSAYGQALNDLAALQTYREILITTPPFMQPPDNLDDQLNFIGLILALATGTAVLVHGASGFPQSASVRRSRYIIFWALALAMLLCLMIPAYAVFLKQMIYGNILGHDMRTLNDINLLPDWIFSYGKAGFISICGAAAESPSAVLQNCQNQDIDILSDPAFQIVSPAAVLMIPDVFGLPKVFAGLILAAAGAAILAAFAGQSLILVNALRSAGFAQWHRSRLVLILAALLTLAISIHENIADYASMLTLITYGFSLAASGLSPVLLFNIWVRPVTPVPAIAAMIAGAGFTAFYIVWTHPAMIDDATAHARAWFGITGVGATLFGLPIGLIVMLILDYFFPYRGTFTVLHLPNKPAPADETDQNENTHKDI